MSKENDENTKEDAAPEEEDVPEAEPEPAPEPVVSVKRSPRELKRQSLLEKAKMLKPKILKLYKHKGFPRTKFEAVTPARFLQNFGLDETDEELLRAVGFAWHQLYDEGKVPSTHMYRPLDEKPDQLPF